jgi:glycosyltransferase involved in cell wall biosynthesis
MILIRPKVTIGVCVKNNAQTISETIKSIIKQDFPRELMELIIVDGYSEDGTLSIIEGQLKNSEIRFKVFREREGLGKARQIVVDNAEGEYIVWVDGDMILSRDFIKKHVEFMDSNPKVGIAKGRYGILKGDEHKNLVAFLEDVEFMLNTQNMGEVNNKVLATSGCIYRVKAIRQAGGFDPFIKGVGEDMDAESRIRALGWRLCITSAVFQELRRKSWKALWNEYVWHGKGGFRLYHKNKKVLITPKVFPPVLIFKKIVRSVQAYKSIRQKRVFLLPLHYIFKRVAWFFGFLSQYEKTRQHKL